MPARGLGPPSPRPPAQAWGRRRAPRRPLGVPGTGMSQVRWDRDRGGLCTLPASAAPGRVTLMGRGRWVPAWVPGQPRRGPLPPGRARLGGAAWAGLPMSPPPASDTARPPPRGHLCDGLSTERAAKQSCLRSLRLSIAIFVIEIPFTR